MLKFVSLLLAIAFAPLSFAEINASSSAYREPGTSYKAYKQSAMLFDSQSVIQHRVTPMGSSQHFGEGTLDDATPWESEEIMLERFKEFRDLRFTSVPSRPDFARRSSWMYPDDGCFARAALAVRNLSQHNYPAPKKVFAFGDLEVMTSNSQSGSVSWWYHVAPLVQIGTQKYVLDPAIHPAGPLKLEEWLAKMNTNPASIEVAICESGTYTPGDDCTKLSDGKEEGALSDQTYYLEAEWERIQSLGRDPERELGEFPPWLDQNSTNIH